MNAITNATNAADIAGLRAQVAEIRALLTGPTEAKAPKADKGTSGAKRCKGVTATGDRCRNTGKRFCHLHAGQKNGVVPPVVTTKGSQTRETLSRKEFNRTVTTRAKFAGGGTYKAILADWAHVRELGTQGVTPDAIVAAYKK